MTVVDSWLSILGGFRVLATHIPRAFLPLMFFFHGFNAFTLGAGVTGLSILCSIRTKLYIQPTNQRHGQYPGIYSYFDKGNIICVLVIRGCHLCVPLRKYRI